MGPRQFTVTSWHGVIVKPRGTIEIHSARATLARRIEHQPRKSNPERLGKKSPKRANTHTSPLVTCLVCRQQIQRGRSPNENGGFRRWQ
jgi:hypothetical protein